MLAAECVYWHTLGEELSVTKEILRKISRLYPDAHESMGNIKGMATLLNFFFFYRVVNNQQSVLNYEILIAVLQRLECKAVVQYMLNKKWFFNYINSI